ncbi:hypothetical protein NDA12_004325 [Ustilago hordei]|nr:hypothetical protein NDA15_002719 [Ustilago hordei]KAJ1594446.1 hypothetical protein NDA12_004325 [Ustilago hordei]
MRPTQITPALRLTSRPAVSHIGLTPRLQRFSTTPLRRDDRSRAKAGPVKNVLNRPEIVPLFLFTGGMICLAVFFAGRHLIKDKELRLDSKQQDRLKTKTEQLDFEAMKRVTEEPEGKPTKEAIEEEKKREERKRQIREEKQEEAENKL